MGVLIVPGNNKALNLIIGQGLKQLLELLLSNDAVGFYFPESEETSDKKEND